MIVRVRLFARAKDLAGTDVLSVELAPNAVVTDLRRQLAVQLPALAALLERSAVAVNEEFARDEQPLPVGCRSGTITASHGG